MSLNWIMASWTRALGLTFLRLKALISKKVFLVTLVELGGHLGKHVTTTLLCASTLTSRKDNP